MGEFAKALKQGLEAALQVEVARQEIDSVFDELNKDVLAATDNGVSILRSEHSFSMRLPSGTRRLGKAIVAFNPSIGAASEVPIAGWYSPDGGYPFTVMGQSTEYDCGDRDGLEACLRGLLSEPGVGLRLLALTRSEPKQK